MGCLLSSPPATPRIFTYAKQEQSPKSVGIKKVDENFLKKPKPPRSSTNANTSLTQNQGRDSHFRSGTINDTRSNVAFNRIATINIKIKKPPITEPLNYLIIGTAQGGLSTFIQCLGTTTHEIQSKIQLFPSISILNHNCDFHCISYSMLQALEQILFFQPKQLNGIIIIMDGTLQSPLCIQQVQEILQLCFTLDQLCDLPILTLINKQDDELCVEKQQLIQKVDFLRDWFLLSTLEGDDNDSLKECNGCFLKMAQSDLVSVDYTVQSMIQAVLNGTQSFLF